MQSQGAGARESMTTSSRKIIPSAPSSAPTHVPAALTKAAEGVCDPVQLRLQQCFLDMYSTAEDKVGPQASSW